jgi:hypothetical protein
MEFGNLIFGNSRGTHPVDRSLQDQFSDWMLKLGFDSYGNFDDGTEWTWGFGNDVFNIQPYYWGDCDCEYDLKEYQWLEEHSHREACYQTEYRKIRDAHGYYNAEADVLIEALCVEHELPYPHGSGVHCTCAYRDEWQAFAAENGHAESCALVQPNFLFKPTGFTLDWYKYPLRDSYSSEPLTKELIDEMFTQIERSMREG